MLGARRHQIVAHADDLLTIIKERKIMGHTLKEIITYKNNASWRKEQDFVLNQDYRAHPLKFVMVEM